MTINDEQLSPQSIKCQNGERKTAAEILACQLPLPKDFVMVFSFNSATDELKCVEYVAQVLGTYTKEAQLFHTEIGHVYVFAFDLKKESKCGDMDKLYSLIRDNLPKFIGNGDIHIQSYYRCDIYLNTGRTIKGERCVLKICVNKDAPLDKDFVFTLTNQYSSKAKSFILKVDSKDIKLK